MREILKYKDGNAFGAMAMDVCHMGDYVEFTKGDGSSAIVTLRNPQTVKIVNADKSVAEEFNLNADTIPRDSLTAEFLRGSKSFLIQNHFVSPRLYRDQEEALESKTTHFFKGLRARLSL